MTIAKIKFSQLPAADDTDIADGDIIPVVNGIASKKITFGNFKEYLVSKGFASIDDVNTRVSNAITSIVGGAPEYLDTLKELADAINNDAGFANTVETLVNGVFGSKTSDDLPEGATNKYFTSGAADYHFDTRFLLKTTTHLEEGSRLYFTTERARDAIFDADDLINFANGGQVGNAQLVHQGSPFDGMDIYSPAGHAWVQLNYDDTNYVWVDEDHVGIDVGTVSWNFTGDGKLELPAGGDIVDSDGNSVLGGGTPAPTNINDLADVVISSPTAGQVLKYNGTNWINDTDATGGGGGGEVGSDPTFTSVTATTVNVRDLNFTGTGAVNITSNNDINLQAEGWITFSSLPKIPTYTLAQLQALAGVPFGAIAVCSNPTIGSARPVWYNGSAWKDMANGDLTGGDDFSISGQ